ncbi:MAG TPA: NAD-dependent epimerase/dehydratase family protein [Gemmatimonadaceae bacterium]|nr:NAD-dependent epimerase/dehydratase family protein [Gemmatimonadaceae bacterium]
MPALRIFLTGGTGFIGAAVARALLAGGHLVTGLVRPASRPRLPSGVVPFPGDLRHPDSYRGAAAACDVVVHAAYEYDGAGREVPEGDVAAVRVMTELLARGSCRVVYTSNAFLLDHPACVGIGEGRALPTELVARRERLRREREICEAGGAAVRVGVVYGGRGGTMSVLLDALAAPDAANPLEGLGNRWSLIHLEDLAALYRAIVEREGGGIYHGVDGCPLSVGDVVALSRAALADLPALGDGIAGAGAATRLREYRHVLGRDIVISPERSLRLGWMPRFGSYRDGVSRAVREWHTLRAAS